LPAAVIQALETAKTTSEKRKNVISTLIDPWTEKLVAGCPRDN
jgi:hypothetical protein